VIRQSEETIHTRGRGFTDLTALVQRFVGGTGAGTGLCNVFLAHTSASLLLCENADPDVRRDLERFMARIAPDGDPMFAHVTEGPDDMPAHVRSVLTQTSIMLPVSGGRCAFGTWQGLYLWEHRHHGHARTVLFTLWGEGGEP